MPSDITHLAFADEHNYESSSGRFGSIALITMKKESYKTVSSSIKNTITEAGVTRTEFKWSETKRTNHKNGAIQLIDISVELALNAHVRIDVILWDYQDARHNITDRDNIKNFHIMYYRLLTNTLHKFWPAGSIWILYPDETSCVNWGNVLSFSNIKSVERTEETLFQLSEALKSYHVRQIRPVVSGKSPVNQLADLFAGLIPYSRHCYDKYEAIKITKEGESLFERAEVKFARVDTNRYDIITQLLKQKEEHKLGISFESSKGFRSLNPSKEFPINVWWYEPQHEKDKAPVKLKGFDYAK